jgi:hypothetical protein
MVVGSKVAVIGSQGKFVNLYIDLHRAFLTIIGAFLWDESVVGQSIKNGERDQHGTF